MARKSIGTIALMILLFIGSATRAQAALIDLFDWAFNIDGATVDSLTLSGLGGYYTPTAADLAGLGGTINVPGFDFSNGPGSGGGLGTVSITVDTAGAHFVGMFVDHEIDEPDNTFFNETGAATGTSGTGQTWEIDEPGFLFGDILDNFLLSVLDDSNGVPAVSPDDVAMAMGFDFVLAAGQTATIDFLLSTTAPASGFILSQTDLDSSDPNTVYFSASLDISTITTLPLPGTLALMGIGLAGFFAVVFPRKHSTD